MDSIVPVTAVPHKINHAPVYLAQRKRCFLKGTCPLTIYWSFTLFAASRYFLPSRLLPLYSRMWSAVKKYRSPLTTPIILHITYSEMLYLSFADVTGFCRPSSDFFEGIFFILQRKGKSKKFPAEIFQPRKFLSRYLCRLLQKDPIWLDFTGRRRVALMKIFIRRFSECVNIALSFLRPLFEPITFGFSSPI